MNALKPIALCCFVLLAATQWGCQKEESSLIEFPAILKVPTEEQRARFRAEITKTERQWNADMLALQKAATNRTVWADRLGDKSLTLSEEQGGSGEIQKFELASGSKVDEIKLPWKEPLTQFFITSADPLTVCFQTRNTNDFQKARIFVGYVTNFTVAQTYQTTGIVLRANANRSRLVFLRSSWERGLNSLHCLDPHTFQEESVVSIQESDPGSGRSFEFFWLNESDALYIGGTARRLGLNTISGPFELVYSPNEKCLYNMRR